ncbi:hypothetical protein O181_100129 [Austropuccinia psidii MF-1]|uniref:Uncharacterized protein n=1 Tax=Austropuccinia psidii MF-1 TaxID=1389203 RepID=A0A9Q3JE16_9BASI|nr:hypothetical protein [Austropuccinia psidii MF-1]
MRPKEAKGGSPLAPQARCVPKPQVGPPEPVFDHGPQSTKFGQELKGTSVAHFQPWPLLTPRGHQLSSNSLFPPNQGEDFSFLHAPHTQGCRSGAYIVLYTIMHHFAQQSNGDIFRTQFHDSKSRS